jgi:GH43 family beta-xylosidase
MKRVLGILVAIILFASTFNIPMNAGAANPTGDGQGLMGEFFKMKPSGDRNDISVFDFDEKKFRGAKIVESLNGDSFLGTFNQLSGTGDFNTARFTGTIVPKYSEEYTFHMEGDDGFKLRINGEEIIDFWKMEWEKPQTSIPITLEAGKHYEIEIEYLQGWGGSWLRMEWESASQNREVVPKSALYPTLKRIIDNKKFDVMAEIQKIDYLTENFADKVPTSILNKFKETKRIAEELLNTIDDKEISDEDKVKELTEAVEPLSIARADFMKEMGVQSSSVSEKFNNPLYQGQDPFVAYHEGFYYYVSSSNLDSNNKVYVSKSRTLTDQGEKVMVFDSKGTQTRIFAPEIFFLEGKWYIYYCADVDEYGYKHMPVVLEAVTDDPQGEYEYKGVLYAGENGEYKQANDFTVFEYGEELYAVWGTLGEGEPIGPAIVKMDNPYTITNDRSFLNKVGGGEGPRILQKDGKVFITMSEGDYQSDGYRLSYLMNTDGDFLNEDSWTRTDDVFVSTQDVSGPARAGFVKSADGKEDWMIYHSRVYKGTERNSWRQVNIKKFGWNEDGTPDFGRPVSPGEWQDYPSGDLGQGDMYQAEDAILYGDITKGTSHKSYQGTGYVNLPNNSGVEASFVVNAEEAGDYIVGVRYAYGVKVAGEYTDGSKVQLPSRAKINVYVNGIHVKTIAPDKTEISWDEWFTGSERLGLKVGKNVIGYRIDNGSIGNVNLDHLTMYKADVPNSIDPTVKATNITMDSNAFVNVGETLQLNATVEPANYTNTIIWTSDNTKVAVVDSNGVVTGKAVGTATIKATIDGLEVSSVVTVQTNIGLDSITLEAEQSTLSRTETTDLNVSGKYSNGETADLSEATIEYVSSNEDVISIEDGVITARDPGTAIVYVKVSLNGYTVTSNKLTVEVITSIESIDQLIDGYVEDGAIEQPLASQLSNSLDQIKHQLDKGNKPQAIKKLNDFHKHLKNKAMDKFIEDEVKRILITDTNVLLETWIKNLSNR